MKYKYQYHIIISLIAIVAALFFLTSCTKSNLPVTQKWRVQEGHDTTTYNHAVFCFASDYGAVDTITLTFNAEPDDSTKFSLKVGSIYFYPGGRKETEVQGVYQRRYAMLIEQIN